MDILKIKQQKQLFVFPLVITVSQRLYARLVYQAISFLKMIVSYVKKVYNTVLYVTTQLIVPNVLSISLLMKQQAYVI